MEAVPWSCVRADQPRFRRRRHDLPADWGFQVRRFGPPRGLGRRRSSPCRCSAVRRAHVRHRSVPARPQDHGRARPGLERICPRLLRARPDPGRHRSDRGVALSRSPVRGVARRGGVGLNGSSMRVGRVRSMAHPADDHRPPNERPRGERAKTVAGCNWCRSPHNNRRPRVDVVAGRDRRTSGANGNPRWDQLSERSGCSLRRAEISSISIAPTHPFIGI